MAFNSLNDLFSKNEETDVKKQIVEKLLNNDDDIASKTELLKPLRWSCLDSIRDFIEKHKMTYSTTILKKFIETSFIYLISNERKGRTEYINALKALAKMDEQQAINPLNPIQSIK